MRNTERDASGKKSQGLIPLIIVGLFALVSMLGDGTLGLFFVLLLLLIPVGILVAVITAAKRRGTSNHTHGRIDHRSDLTINPRTGKTENRPVRSAAPHSPQAHWKQQLDGLLANGTIDRAEYRALLNRKF